MSIFLHLSASQNVWYIGTDRHLLLLFRVVSSVEEITSDKANLAPGDRLLGLLSLSSYMSNPPTTGTCVHPLLFPECTHRPCRQRGKQHVDCQRANVDIGSLLIFLLVFCFFNVYLSSSNLVCFLSLLIRYFQEKISFEICHVNRPPACLDLPQADAAR